MLGDTKIEVGMLLKVKRKFWTSGRQDDKGIPVKHLIEKGQIIEIRYPFEWHFRTEQDVYDHAETKTLIKNCNYFGKVDSEIQWRNKHKLKEILELKLYD